MFWLNVAPTAAVDNRTKQPNDAEKPKGDTDGANYIPDAKRKTQPQACSIHGRKVSANLPPALAVVCRAKMPRYTKSMTIVTVLFAHFVRDLVDSIGSNQEKQEEDQKAPTHGHRRERKREQTVLHNKKNKTEIYP